MFRGISKKDVNNDKLIQCGPDEIRMEDGTVRIMTETELLNRRIDDATEEFLHSLVLPLYPELHSSPPLSLSLSEILTVTVQQGAKLKRRIDIEDVISKSEPFRSCSMSALLHPSLDATRRMMALCEEM
ncbi:hypothetical protein ACTXT7_002990 [Hymenolepis weldensis]